MAAYTRANPRRSPRNLPPVSHVQTRPYNRSAAVAAAPARKAPAKKAPAKKAPLKKAPAKKNPKKRSREESSAPDSEDGSEDAPEPPAKKSRAGKRAPKKANKESVASEDDEELDSTQAKKAPAKKLKKAKEASPSDDDEFLDDEEDEDGNDPVSPVAPLAEPDADDRLEPPDDEDIPIDGSDFNIYHNRRTLEMWVLATWNLFDRWAESLDDQTYQELEGLRDEFNEQFREAAAQLEQIRANHADPHPTYAEIYQRLAEDPESPRAALEAELRRRGLLIELRYFTIDGLRIMYETWMEYEDENGHAPRDPVEETQVFDNFLDSAGLDD